MDMQHRKRRQQISTWVLPALGLKERLRRIKAMDPRLTESRITEEALMHYLPSLEERLKASTVIALVALVLVVALPAFGENAYLWSNNQPQGTIIQGSPNAPAYYYGMDGTRGTILPGSGGNSYWWMNRPDGSIDSGYIQGLPPAPAAPALPFGGLPPMPFTDRERDCFGLYTGC